MIKGKDLIKFIQDHHLEENELYGASDEVVWFLVYREKFDPPVKRTGVSTKFEDEDKDTKYYEVYVDKGINLETGEIEMEEAWEDNPLWC